jgi:short-subunit dehydrogenase
MTGFAARYGPWALIAGASEGLGAAFATAAASRGVNVVVVARRQAPLEAVAARLEAEHGVSARAVVADMADPTTPTRLAEATADLEIGLLVYNAAASAQGRFLDVSFDEHVLNIAVNVTTPTALAYHFGRAMRDRGRGGIVLVSSMAALQGTKIFASYAAAKSYELILGEGLWDELRDHGVDALGYVVGATATAHMLQSASADVAHGDGVATLGNAAGQQISARSVEFVAEQLMAHLGDGPRRYSHPDDETHAKAGAVLERGAVVTAMGQITSAFFD